MCPALPLDGRHLAYDVRGDGPHAVVCLPGMGDLRAQYRHLVPPLVAAGHRVVTLDLRGHGDSDTGFATHAPEAVGADVLTLLDHLGVARATVVGNSAAAASAVWAAAEAPERVDGLVLLGPVVRDGGMGPWMHRLLRLAFLPAWGPLLWSWFYRSLFKGGTPPDHEAHVAAVRDRLRNPARRAAMLDNGLSSKAACAARLGEVRAPVLLVMGAADPDFPDARQEAAEVGALLRADVRVLDGVGHYPHQERPAETAALVVDFLAGTA